MANKKNFLSEENYFNKDLFLKNSMNYDEIIEKKNLENLLIDFHDQNLIEYASMNSSIYSKNENFSNQINSSKLKNFNTNEFKSYNSNDLKNFNFNELKNYNLNESKNHNQDFLNSLGYLLKNDKNKSRDSEEKFEKNLNYEEQEVNYSKENNLGSIYFYNQSKQNLDLMNKTIERNNLNELNLEKYIKSQELNNLENFIKNKPTALIKLIDSFLTSKKNQEEKGIYSTEECGTLKSITQRSDEKLKSTNDFSNLKNLNDFNLLKSCNSDKLNFKLYDSTGETNSESNNSNNSSINLKSTDLSQSLNHLSNFCNNQINQKKIVNLEKENLLSFHNQPNLLEEFFNKSIKTEEKDINSFKIIELLDKPIENFKSEFPNKICLNNDFTSKISLNDKHKHSIENGLNNFDTKNLDIIMALESNNNTMKNNLRMTEALKLELETTKKDFELFKQHSNLILQKISEKNKNLNEDLSKEKKDKIFLINDHNQEIIEIKRNFVEETNKLKKKVSEKENQIEIIKNDYLICDEKFREKEDEISNLNKHLTTIEKKNSFLLRETTNLTEKLSNNEKENDSLKRRLIVLEKNLNDRNNQNLILGVEIKNLKESNTKLKEENEKNLQNTKSKDILLIKYEEDLKNYLLKEKELEDLKKAIKRVITERDESINQLNCLKTNLQEYRQIQENQLLKYHQETCEDYKNKIYSPIPFDYKHQSDFFKKSSCEKIDSNDNMALINIISKQNYIKNLITLSEQINCGKCLVSENLSQYGTIPINTKKTSNDLKYISMLQKENELKQSKKAKKNLMKLSKLDKKSKSQLSLFSPSFFLQGFRHKG